MGPIVDAGSDTGGAQPGGEGGAAAGACTSLCPVGYWAFDEPAGDLKLVDGSGHGNDALLGAVARTVGQRGGGLDFGAFPGAADVPTPASLDIEGTEISIAFWVTLVAPKDPYRSAYDQHIVSKSWKNGAFDYPYVQYAVEWDWNESKAVQFIVGDDKATAQFVVSMTVPAGRWAHVAFVYDGARVRGYLDGKLAVSTAMTFRLQKRPTDLRFGADSAGEQRFSGKLDEVRIFDRVLPEADIAQLAKP